MKAIYTARYRDRYGEEITSITNNGKELTMVVRGVEFRGSDFDSLGPVSDCPPARLSSFVLQHNDLCSCVIEADMPLPVVVGDRIEDGVLNFHLELGNPRPKGGIDTLKLVLHLTFADQAFRSRGTSGWFEDELLDLQRQMHDGVYLKACINCLFSDYGPGGHGLFGGMACFRDNKEGYLKVKNKWDLFDVWNTKTEVVQETYLCPEFQRRIPGTGYRG